MSRPRTVHRCQSCGATSPKWVGRCPGCEEWNTLVEERDAALGDSLRPGVPHDPPAAAVPIGEVDVEQFRPRPVGLAEVDRVLSGGLAPGSVTLLGGEPGIGKSTLLLQVAASVAASGAKVLYVSAEESCHQVRLRADRLGAVQPGLLLASDAIVEHLAAQVRQVVPDLLIVDSIQTVYTPELGSAPGSVAQVRECASTLAGLAKRTATATVLVGHVTKDGALAGPRVLEHLVDTVLSFEGDRRHALRLLRAVKHRFGSTSELGVLEMGGAGLVGVADPSSLLLADRRPGTDGSVLVPALDGRRPLLVELQALAVKSEQPSPRRAAEGIDSRRLTRMLAVLDAHVGMSAGRFDVHALVVGGIQLDDPGADLGLAVAVMSSITGAHVPDGLVFVGEVGLGGELRQVGHLETRLNEAARLGMRQAVVPATATVDAPAGLVLTRCDHVVDALQFVIAPGGGRRRPSMLPPESGHEAAFGDLFAALLDDAVDS